MPKFSVDDRFRVPEDAELEELRGKQGIVTELPQGSILSGARQTLPIPPISEFTPIYKVKMDDEQESRYLEETQMEAI